MPSKGEKKREREKGLRFRTRTASSSGSNKHVDVLLRRPTTGRREQQQRHNSEPIGKRHLWRTSLMTGLHKKKEEKKSSNCISAGARRTAGHILPFAIQSGIEKLRRRPFSYLSALKIFFFYYYYSPDLRDYACSLPPFFNRIARKRASRRFKWPVTSD